MIEPVGARQRRDAAVATGALVRTAASQAFSRVATAYVALWLVEGAIRKWVPGADLPFYVARDVFLIVSLAWIAIRYPVRNRLAGTLFWFAIWAFTLFVITSAIFVTSSFQTVIVGLRTYVAASIFVFAIWKYRPKAFVRSATQLILAAAPLEAAIAIAQVASPKSALINVLVSGEDSTLSFGDGLVRASGTFSSPTGMTFFVTIAFGVSLASRVAEKPMKFGLVGLASVIVIVAVGGSRGALFSCMIVLLAFCLYSLIAGRFRQIATLIGVLLVVSLSSISAALLFPTVLAGFVQRLTTASDSQIIGTRVTDTIFGFSELSVLVGSGAGSRTPAGAAISGVRWVEDESARVITELGIVGYLFLGLKVAVLVWLIANALRQPRQSHPLVWPMTAAVAPVIATGGVFGAPTNQAFVAIALALVMLVGFDDQPSMTRSSASNGRTREQRVRSAPNVTSS